MLQPFDWTQILVMDGRDSEIGGRLVSIRSIETRTQDTNCVRVQGDPYINWVCYDHPVAPGRWIVSESPCMDSIPQYPYWGIPPIVS